MPAKKSHHRKNRGPSKYQQRAAEVNRQQDEQRSQKQKNLASLPERNYHNKTRVPISGIALVVISLAIGIGIFVVWGPKDNTDPGYARSTAVDTSNPDILKIPVSEITSTVRFYTYDSNGVTVKYFAVRDGSGNVVVATNACDVCYSQKKGFVQVGTSMKCNNCGNQYAISGIENAPGAGCWPSYLANDVNNGYLEVSKTALDAKRFMFA